MELTISLETVCRLVALAREMEAQLPSSLDDDADEDEIEDGEGAEGGYAGLDDDADEEIEEEVVALLDDLAEDEIAEILALAWIGRGTYDASEWGEALAEAAEAARDGGNSEAAIDQLREFPILAGCLEAGLAAFDLSCAGIG